MPSHDERIRRHYVGITLPQFGDRTVPRNPDARRQDFMGVDCGQGASVVLLPPTRYLCTHRLGCTGVVRPALGMCEACWDWQRRHPLTWPRP